MAREFNQQVEVQHQPAHADSAVDHSVADASAGDANTTVNRSINDPNSPYYLHYGDNTGMQLISIMLSEDNYTTWSRAVIIALSVKNKEGFIDGSIVKPAENDLLYGAWRRCNHDNNSINSYFNRFKGLWEELDNYRPEVSSADYKAEDRVMQFLMGLDDRFSSVRSQILLMDPLPSLNKVFALVLQDERQKGIVAKKQQSFDIAAFANKAVSSSYGNQRHNVSNQTQRKEMPICTYCGMLGHLRGECYKLIGYSPGHRLAKGKSSVANAVVRLPRQIIQS
ncbi:uncharacterized protein LOC111378917 [Olea europaea var. sylvestris]|uniref:uncharacterized protein LOC111378917 n=1 Tax=Olea europaea var. sylvestris TaxID=158386 RepID=UPI000C1D892D|nr:uncharacterized protein LOC111378917 [Olea europaea var. sylvestris]